MGNPNNMLELQETSFFFFFSYRLWVMKTKQKTHNKDSEAWIEGKANLNRSVHTEQEIINEFGRKKKHKMYPSQLQVLSAHSARRVSAWD